MGLTIILEGENGDKYESIIDDGILSKILPDYNDKSSYCLRFIDLYGDTTFNNLQMPELIKELELLINKVDTHEKQLLVNDLLRLSLRCQAEPHLYLKFYGD